MKKIFIALLSVICVTMSAQKSTTVEEPETGRRPFTVRSFGADRRFHTVDLEVGKRQHDAGHISDSAACCRPRHIDGLASRSRHE